MSANISRNSVFIILNHMADYFLMKKNMKSDYSSLQLIIKNLLKAYICKKGK